MVAPVPPALPLAGSNRQIPASAPPAPCAGPSATTTVTVAGGLPFQRLQQQQAQALAARAPFTCTPTSTSTTTSS